MISQSDEATASGGLARAIAEDLDGSAYLQAAERLHAYIEGAHWNGQSIVGPDPVGKVHWRVTRFVRSYLPWLPGNDSYTYHQGQAYWVRGNLKLLDLTGESRYLGIVESCADGMVARQPHDGAWRHPPIRGRQGFISTVEGVWASLGLVAAYRRTGKQVYLDSALKWYRVQVNLIGFQRVGDGLAANYYSHSRSIVPNVTTMLIWLTAELSQATGDERYLDRTHDMLHFIEQCQLASGELPYVLHSRPHFMCYQYNSFQFLDLAHYYQLAGGEECRRILSRLAVYLSSGVTERGQSRYSCSKKVPEVHYWTAALAAALRVAHDLELGDYLSVSERAYHRLLDEQRADGGYDFSERNYALLRDRRSYPRYLAMILCHLLCRAERDTYEALPRAGASWAPAVSLVVARREA
jgi:hypothetical protein